jgi:hypothetical protein
MDIAGIAAASTARSTAQFVDAVQIAVLKKALQLEGQGALQLVQAATQVVNNNPPSLGGSVDTFA